MVQGSEDKRCVNSIFKGVFLEKKHLKGPGLPLSYSNPTDLPRSRRRDPEVLEKTFLVRFRSSSIVHSVSFQKRGSSSADSPVRLPCVVSPRNLV